jgi:callose synthase
VEDFPRDSVIKDNVRVHLNGRNKETELFMDAVTLPNKDDEPFFKHLLRLHTTLSTRDPLLNVPKGLEAKRRISFFSNSLFMTMPRAPQVLFNTIGFPSSGHVALTLRAIFLRPDFRYLSV